MRYLIIYRDQTAFYTDWYDYENHYSDEIICVVDRATDNEQNRVVEVDWVLRLIDEIMKGE